MTTRFADVRKVLAPAARWPRSVWSSAWRSPRRAHTCCSASIGSWRCCSGPSFRHRCGRGVLGAAGAAVAAPRCRPARGRVRIQRCAGRHPRADVQRDALELSPVHALADLVYELLAGSAIGLACGFLGAIALRRIALPASGLYPIATFGLGMVAFAAAGSAHASGFIAAYLAAVVLANSGLPTGRRPGHSPKDSAGWRRSACSSCSGCWWIPASWRRGGARDHRRPRPAAGRPAAVGGRLVGRIQRAVAGAGVPVVGRSAGRGPHRAGDLSDRRGVPDSHRLLNIVFILVVVYTLVQGPSLRLLAHGLGLIPRSPPARSRSNRRPSTCSKPNC